MGYFEKVGDHSEVLAFSFTVEKVVIGLEKWLFLR
jgi:hypothetical protein